MEQEWKADYRQRKLDGVHLTLSQRRERGETLVSRKGTELVHGRVLAREALADYDELVEEHSRHYRSSSPYRSDYAEIEASINSDIADQAAELAQAIATWLDDEAWEAEKRGYDVANAAFVAEAS
jgi:hypothetical protein